MSGLASNIGVDWVVAHDPTRPFTSAAKYDAVTADDVMRVAKKYLVKTNLSMVTLVPAKPRSRLPATGGEQMMKRSHQHTVAAFVVRAAP